MFLFSTSLPVADPSYIIDDGYAFPAFGEAPTFDNIDASGSFISVFNFLITSFRTILNYMDSIIIFSNTSLLEFFLALSVFSILFSALIVTVRSSVGNSISSVDRSKRSNRNRGVD